MNADERRARDRAAARRRLVERRKALVEAADLEARAGRLASMIATLESEKMRCIVQATALRVQAAL